MKLNEDFKTKIDIEIKNQKSSMDNFLPLDLQKVFAGVATLELEEVPGKDDKNFERRDKEYSKQILEFSLRTLKKEEYKIDSGFLLLVMFNGF